MKWLPSVDGIGGWLLLLLASLHAAAWLVPGVGQGPVGGLVLAVAACGLAFAAVSLGWRCC